MRVRRIHLGKAIGWVAILVVLIVVAAEMYLFGIGMPPMEVLRTLWLSYVGAQLLVIIAGLVARTGNKGEPHA